MSKNLSLAFAKKLLLMLQGGTVPASRMREKEVEEFIMEGLLATETRKTKKSYRIIDPEGCRLYLSHHYGITGTLEQWIEIKSKTEASRAEQTREGGNSKLRNTRVFKGFLINSYIPIQTTLRGMPFNISPPRGTSIWLEDFEHFNIPEDIVVVGVENSENFHHPHTQRYLFEGLTPLFVSRYPQSKDLRTWLQRIPNRYLHFGDFDLAGIHIYLTEFHAYLGNRAQYFIPPDIESRICNGNRTLYD